MCTHAYLCVHACVHVCCCASMLAHLCVGAHLCSVEARGYSVSLHIIFETRSPMNPELGVWLDFLARDCPTSPVGWDLPVSIILPVLGFHPCGWGGDLNSGPHAFPQERYPAIPLPSSWFCSLGPFIQHLWRVDEGLQINHAWVYETSPALWPQYQELEQTVAGSEWSRQFVLGLYRWLCG